MKGRKSNGYKNYGPIPQNEYTAANSGQNTYPAPVAAYALYPDATAYKQRLVTRQALHPSGRSNVGGWSRSWKANGWRNESASHQNEAIGMREHTNNVRRG